ncbi:MAG: hypothetical protein ABSH50_30920 [Bryobacteraceae bacterium]
MSLLYGLHANDSRTIAIAALLLAVVTQAASYLPARRASRLEPMAALRGRLAELPRSSTRHAAQAL